METIWKQALEKVAQGARFNVNFEKRSLKVNGKYLIKDSQYNGELGCSPAIDPISHIEKLYNRYQHSVPSERSENKMRNYFRALPEHEMSDDDMLYGIYREEAQVELELYVLCQIIHGTIKWDEIAKDKWFWQSQTFPSLIILKKWVA